MTIFIIGTIEETAKALDIKRFNKQILECQWMINMKEGKTKPSNHPAYLMYKDHIDWVKLYQKCLIAYKEKRFEFCHELSELAKKIQPPFICDELCENFKKRLFEKDPLHYKQWETLGKSFANYYFVDNEWLKYENGTKIIVENCGI